jgi:uncharacterized Fe-S cluster protein YjdI
MAETRKTYTKDGLTIVWQPSLCMHSEKCFHGLPGVFDPNRRPWIDPGAASPQEIVAQVARCPSGALSIAADPATASAPPVAAADPTTTAELRIQVRPNGPLLIAGPVTIVRPDGSVETRPGNTALCRCGGSRNKPFCDGSHKSNGFVG